MLTLAFTSLYNPAMALIERGILTPGEANRDLQIPVKSYLENKYQSQVGLKDLDFDVNQDILNALGLSAPFQTISQAELALRNHAIHPIRFIEDDNTEHLVLFFDPQPVGFSGFMKCAIHSLGLTNHGLFEVGRYPASRQETRCRGTASIFQTIGRSRFAAPLVSCVVFPPPFRVLS